MNVEIGTEAAKFLEKECINGIFVAVHTVTVMWRKKVRDGEPWNNEKEEYHTFLLSYDSGPRSPSPLIASVGEPESRKTKREGRMEAIVVVSAEVGGGRSQIRQQQKTVGFSYFLSLRGKVQLEEGV